MTKEKIDLVISNFLTHPEWDPISAGKIVTLGTIHKLRHHFCEEENKVHCFFALSMPIYRNSEIKWS